MAVEELEDVYEGYDEEEVNEIEGITDSVTDYTYADLSYPCIIFKDGMQMEMHKVKIISNMVKSPTKCLAKDIALYFVNDGELFKLGSISGMQVMALIDIVGREKLDAYMDRDIHLSDSLIYTLCST